jgi:hypothetical protein
MRMRVSAGACVSTVRAYVPGNNGGGRRRNLRAGELLGEFAGAIIDQRELLRRKKIYDKLDAGTKFCYVFNLGA